VSKIKKEKCVEFSYSSYILGIPLNYPGIAKFAALGILLVVRYQLEKRENVPKVRGVVNQVSYRRGVQFYGLSVQIFPRSFGCANFTQIDQILSM